MEVEWLRTAVRGLAAVCLIASIVECAVEDGESAGGLRLGCGGDRPHGCRCTPAPLVIAGTLKKVRQIPGRTSRRRKGAP